MADAKTVRRLPLPPGFKFILETIAREVVQQQPDDIHVCAAECLEKLLQERQETGKDPTLQDNSRGRSDETDTIQEKENIESGQDSDTLWQNEQTATTEAGSAQVQELTMPRESEQPPEDINLTEALDAENTIDKAELGSQDALDFVEDVNTHEAKDAPPPAVPEVTSVPAEEVEMEVEDLDIQDAQVLCQNDKTIHDYNPPVTVDNTIPENRATLVEQKPLSEGESITMQTELVSTEEIGDAADVVVAEQDASKTEDESGETKDAEVLIQDVMFTTENEAKDVPILVKEEDEEVVEIDLTDPEVNEAALKIQAGFRGHRSRQHFAVIKNEKKNPSSTEEAIGQDKDNGEAAYESSVHSFKEEDLVNRETVVTPEVIKEDLQQNMVDFEVEASQDLSAPQDVTEIIIEDSQGDTDILQDVAEVTVEDLPGDTDLQQDLAKVTTIEVSQGDTDIQDVAEVIVKVSEETEIQQHVAEDVATQANMEQDEEEVDIDLTDPDVNEAALKIQAGFRGHQSRQRASRLKAEKRKSLSQEPTLGVRYDQDVKIPDDVKDKAKINYDETTENPEEQVVSEEKGMTGSPKASQGQVFSKEEEVLHDRDDTPSAPCMDEEMILVHDTMEVEQSEGVKSSVQNDKDINQVERQVKTVLDEIHAKQDEEKEVATQDFKDVNQDQEVISAQDNILTKQDEEIETAAQDNMDVKLDEATEVTGQDSMDAKQDEATEVTGQDSMDAKQDEATEVTGQDSMDVKLDEATEAMGPDSMDVIGDEEEEVDIDLTDPEVNEAALKIQAGFRGHQSRQRVAVMKEKKSSLSSSPVPTSEDQLVIDGGEQTTQNMGNAERETAPAKDETKETEEEIDIDLTDPEVNEAALKIQAGFRGHCSRQELAKHKTNAEQQNESAE